MVVDIYKWRNDLLQNIFDGIARLVNAEAGIVTRDYAWIHSNNSPLCEFCKLVQTLPEGERACDNLKWRADIIAAGFRSEVIYKCPFGLVQIVLPIHKDDRYLGSLYCGNFLDTSHNEDGIRALLAKLPAGADAERIAEAYGNISVFPPQKVYDVKNILTLMTKSIAEILDDDGSSTSMFDRMIDYIEINYKNALTLDELSAVSGFSSSYISQLFKKRSGLSLNRYIAKVRIQKAKDLLVKRDMNVSEAAREVGYKDQNYFSRVFKNIEGFAPSTFKAKFSGGSEKPE